LVFTAIAFCFFHSNSRDNVPVERGRNLRHKKCWGKLKDPLAGFRGGEWGRGMERVRDGKGMEGENEKEGEMEMKGRP